jgi:Gp157 protein
VSTSLRLYETVDALEVVRQWVSEHANEIVAAGGELPPELADLVDKVELDFEQKVERVALYIRELLVTSSAIDEEAKRLASRSATLKRTAEGLKGYLLGQLTRAEVQKVEGKLATVRIQRNPPAVRCSITDLRDLSERSPDVVEATTNYRLRSDVVLAMWKDEARRGEIPPGISIEQGTHLRIA